MKKVALRTQNNKRHLILGQPDTLPYGNFRIMDDGMIHAVIEVEAEEAEENLNEERRDTYI